jgi:protein required for attachment to host cells
MLDHDVIIAVCDAQRAHVYRNTGTPRAPKLDFMIGFEQKNPRSSELGTDKPGTTFASAGGSRSQISDTDFHYARQKAFAQDILKALSELANENKVSKLIWVALPRMLALLRADMPKQLKDITLTEIDKDLTKHPTAKIVDLLTSYHF